MATLNLLFPENLGCSEGLKWCWHVKAYEQKAVVGYGHGAGCLQVKLVHSNWNLRFGLVFHNLLLPVSGLDFQDAMSMSVPRTGFIPVWSVWCPRMFLVHSRTTVTCYLVYSSCALCVFPGSSLPWGAACVNGVLAEDPIGWSVGEQAV